MIEKYRKNQTINLTSMDNIAIYVDELIKQTDLANLPPDIRREKSAELEVLVQNLIGDTVLSNLSEQSRLEYLELLKKDLSPDPKELEIFLQKNLPNYLDLVQEALRSFGADYLKSIQ